MKLSLISIQELYSKFPELKETDVGQIHDWMEKQPHLPKITDQEIAIALHARYFSIENAKILLENRYTVRTHVKELFSSRDILADDMQMIKDIVVAIPLPKLTPEGYQLVFWKITDSDMSKYNFKAMVKLGTFAYETEILEKGPVNGYVVLIDMDGFTLRHMLQFNPSLMFQLMFFLQEAYEVRLKGFCFFNTVAFMDKFLALIKPMMKKEIVDNLKTYQTLDQLSEYIPLDVLPSNYKGGEQDSVENLWAKYLDYLKDRRDYFLDEEKTRRVNESLRPNKSPLESQLFGMDGSFRKLDID